jgi:hypothetical protein
MTARCLELKKAGSGVVEAETIGAHALQMNAIKGLRYE